MSLPETTVFCEVGNKINFFVLIIPKGLMVDAEMGNNHYEK